MDSLRCLPAEIAAPRYDLFVELPVDITKETITLQPTAAAFETLHSSEITAAAMVSVIHLVYASVATQEFHPSQLTDLLRQSRAANERANITGMLLYTERSFFQVLEGEPAAVDKLSRKIQADPRHKGMIVIIREPIARRSFEEWSMGFSAVSFDELTQIVGKNDFFDQGSCLARLNSGRARKLLGAFAGGRWRASIAGPATVSP
jgi:hypothetical protein